MSLLLGIDPGNQNSAFVYFDTDKKIILEKQKLSNDECLYFFRTTLLKPDICIIEQIAGMGLAVGESVFETAVWSGRFMECLLMLNLKVDRIKRIQIKNIICGTSRAKDVHIRRALLDKFGGDTAQGNKKNPGILYGIKKDMWSALAVIVAWNMIESGEFKY
jgi:hypothetical protein